MPFALKKSRRGRLDLEISEVTPIRTPQALGNFRTNNFSDHKLQDALDLRRSLIVPKMVGKSATAKLALRKPKKPPTPSTKNHRFEPFSQRIARLKIDPVRRLRDTQIESNDGPTSSYFRNTLNEWLDRNLSEDFTDFAKQVLPISDSLAQIIHHERRIIDLLLASIERGHTVALEPLLDLVAHFAHDLGLRFEKHFEKTVSTVSKLAAKHQDVEVIEWSFNCLAWLFKYLSRLLVPDLCPVYDLMAPLLGKERQKPFVARFAAEAISFLLRKAAVHAHKDGRPLHLIVEHVLHDLCSSANSKSDLYEQGLIVLFAESIKGSQGTLHSGGQALFRELLSVAFMSFDKGTEPPTAVSRVLQEVVIMILQHADAQSFEPIITIVLSEYKPDAFTATHLAYGMLYLRLLFCIVALNGGSKVASWSLVLDHINSLLSETPSERDVKLELLKVYAVAHHNCSLKVAMTQVKFLEILASDPQWRPYFLGFCSFYGELGNDRFKDMLLPYFKRFLVSHWKEFREQLCLAIPQFSSAGRFGKSKITLPELWMREIANDFAETHQRGEKLVEIHYKNGLLELLGAIKVDSETEREVISGLYRGAETVFKEVQTRPLETLDIFLAGNAFRYFSSRRGERELGASNTLTPAINHFKAFHVFWQAFLAYLERSPPASLLDLTDDATIGALMDCASCPDHSMRLTTLQILDCVETAKSKKPSDILQLAISIESTIPSVDTIRTITMHLRNLTKLYHDLEAHSYLLKVIPTFCFGLLHVRLAPIWDSVCNTLKEICSRKEGEETVCNIAFQWMEDSEGLDIREDDNGQKSPKNPWKDSSETGLERLRNQAESAFRYFELPGEQLKAIFERIHAPTTFLTSFNRTQALRVLKSIPQSAQKRSRMLVPVLLDWALDDGSNDTSTSADEIPEAHADFEKKRRWSRKDQKAMLSLFAEFHNPKVFYRSSEVYAAMLALLSHGDTEIQKSALKAILTWKHPIVSRYEEHLMDFLDDAKFKDQLTVFLDIGSGDDSLQEDHRADILPIVFRLMYGRIVMRGRGDQQANRRTVFILLSRFRPDEIRQFLSITIGRLDQLKLVEDGIFQEHCLKQEILDQRKQLGLVNMLHDLLETLKSTAAPFAPQLIDSVVYCLIRATHESVESSGAAQATEVIKVGLARSIRQMSLRCLIQLFEIRPDFGWNAYLPTIYSELVAPRLEKLVQENAQSVSALLKLFSAWAQHEQTVSFLSSFERQVISRLAECISYPATKEEVRRFVVNDIFNSIADLAENAGKSSVAWSLLAENASTILQHVGLALKTEFSRELLENSVELLVRLADIVPTSSADLLSSLPFLLLQPSKKVPVSTKTAILGMILRTIPTVALADQLFEQLHRAICSSFAYFSDRESRLLLCDILHALSKEQSSLTAVANVCSDLNSYASKRVNEPDFDRRTAAFNLLNEKMHNRLDAQQWEPLLHNMLFFIKDTEELGIRTSATQSLRRFVDAAAHQWMNDGKGSTDEKAEGPRVAAADKSNFLNMLEKIILASIERGIRDQPEVIRTEYLTVFSHAVAQLPAWPPLSGMTTLLEPDDEASFFNNVLHIQQHRRVRALKRLVEEVNAGHVASNGLAHFIIPLIERFVFDGEGAGEVSGEAVRTIGTLLEGLDWNQYRSVMRRYIGDIKKRPEIQEVVLRLVDGAASALSKCARRKFDGDADVAMSEGSEESVSNEEHQKLSRLQQTLPGQEKLSSYLLDNVLPSLESFLRDKDDEVVSRRTMVAVTAARFLILLPRDKFQVRLPAVLLDTCNILRSKDPVSRDAARKALSTMCQIIGASSVSFVLKALRSALQRGFHLHVLSYTVHSILTATTPHFNTGELDYCVNEIVTIAMDDIFGDTGEEKDELEYLKDKASKKEIKQKTSFDTMELLASITSLPYLIELIRPIEFLLLENLTQKMLGDVDKLLGRVTKGLEQNPGAQDRGILVFCHELISDANRLAGGASSTTSAQKTGSKYLVRKVQNPARQRLTPKARVAKVAQFGLELLRCMFKKHKDLATPANIEGLMPIIGDAVVDEQENLKLAAFRLFTQIVKVPLRRIEDDAPVYVAEAVKVIEQSEGMEREELPAAAFKLVAAVLREERTVQVKERVVGLVLKQLRPDLQVKSKQGSAFTLLKAIISRKIIIPEVYELMDGDDGIAAIWVRDHDGTTRDQARSVWIKFVMDYPQGKSRAKKQLAFLAANLNYEHAEGRIAVMETLHRLLSKASEELVKQIISVVDWSLVAVMVNDDKEECRELASTLVKEIIARADGEWEKGFQAKLRWMLNSDNKLVLRRTALQCWALYIDAKDVLTNFDDFVLEAVGEILDPADDLKDDQYWELIFYALNTLRIICKQSPNIGFNSDTVSRWDHVAERLNYPHAWVKHESAKLIGMFLKYWAKQRGMGGLPPFSAEGYPIGQDDLCGFAKRHLRLLSNGMSKQLANQVVVNLSVTGAWLAAGNIDWMEVGPKAQDDDSGKGEDNSEEEEDVDQGDKQLAIDYLFQNLSKILRRQPSRSGEDAGRTQTRINSVIPKRAALDIFVKLIEDLPAEDLSRSVDNILLPLIHLNEGAESAAFSYDPAYKQAMDDLTGSAAELLGKLEKKLDTNFVKAFQRVKKGIRERRDERKTKRKIETVAMPEKAERLKRKKQEALKVRKKEKASFARGKRRGW